MVALARFRYSLFVTWLSVEGVTLVRTNSIAFHSIPFHSIPKISAPPAVEWHRIHAMALVAPTVGTIVVIVVIVILIVIIIVIVR